MKYALANGVKSEASSGAVGTCETCGSVMIAKCVDLLRFIIGHTEDEEHVIHGGKTKQSGTADGRTDFQHMAGISND